MESKNRKLTARWTFEDIGDLGKQLHEAPLSEEDRIIERLKYTKKELDAMYAKSLDDELSEVMAKSIAEEIDKALLQEMMRIVKNGETST